MAIISVCVHCKKKIKLFSPSQKIIKLLIYKKERECVVIYF